ncbi:glycosyltransferase, partial [Xenorhabdus bovienii]|uniref:glycosyltransferase family 32 protein n=1 Tax=Xenorhabdus bovienii TaxID=40576 RepID=UPI002A6EF9BF|nr:glycosyltransferase [Xenorhabdus bovienii]
MIPKKIHYVWVGDKPKTKFVLVCIDTWKKFLPDYEIIEWNNENVKNIKNNYMEEAFINKKWAFVSDYIRLYAL